MHARLLAQITNPALPNLFGGTGGQTGGEAIGTLIGNLIGAIFIFAFLMAFVQLLVGGISWITAGGDKGKLQEARDKITQALVGLVVIGAVWAIAVLIGRFIGIDLAAGATLRLPIPTIQ